MRSPVRCGKSQGEYRWKEREEGTDVAKEEEEMRGYPLYWREGKGGRNGGEGEEGIDLWREWRGRRPGKE